MNMNGLIQQVQELAASADENGRYELMNTLQKLYYSLETPRDALDRIAGSNLRIAVVVTGCDMGLFELLSKASEPMKTSDISKELGSSELLTCRILRYLANFDLVKEVGQSTFTKTTKTVAFADPAFKGSVHHFFYSTGPVCQNLPEALAANQYQDMTDNTKTALNRAFQTDLPAFSWIVQHPENLANFNQYMTVQHSEMPEWLSIFPVESKCASWNKERSSSAPLLVDVGGSLGHQCRAFRDKYPDLPGKIILQDLPQTLKLVPPSNVFEKMEHNFWEPQPVKGAKFYYLRNILHDYPDSKCQMLLGNIIAAMNEESLILIDEMVVPDTGISWQAAQMDLWMMGSFAALERTKQQWHKLLDSAGLKIQDIFTYTISLQNSVIVAVRK